MAEAYAVAEDQVVVVGAVVLGVALDLEREGQDLDCLGRVDWP